MEAGARSSAQRARHVSNNSFEPPPQPPSLQLRLVLAPFSSLVPPGGKLQPICPTTPLRCWPSACRRCPRMALRSTLPLPIPVRASCRRGAFVSLQRELRDPSRCPPPAVLLLLCDCQHRQSRKGERNRACSCTEGPSNNSDITATQITLLCCCAVPFHDDPISDPNAFLDRRRLLALG